MQKKWQRCNRDGEDKGNSKGNISNQESNKHNTSDSAHAQDQDKSKGKEKMHDSDAFQNDYYPEDMEDDDIFDVEWY